MEKENEIRHHSFYDYFNEFGSEEEQEYKKAAGIPNADTYEELLKQLRAEAPINEKYTIQNKQKVKKTEYHTLKQYRLSNI